MADQIALPPAVPAFSRRFHIRFVRVRRSVGESLLSAWMAFQRWRVKRVVANTVRDANAKCFACGARDGEMKWSPSVVWNDGSGAKGGLIHRCKICNASWAEKPIIAARHWDLATVPEEMKKNAA